MTKTKIGNLTGEVKTVNYDCGCEINYYMGLFDSFNPCESHSEELGI